MYRDKGYRTTTLKTIMGEVGYRRHVYQLSESNDTAAKTIYLLDKNMGLDTVGFFSDTVCMMAIEAACAVSYRTAAATLSDLTGLNISHESVWRIVQSAGSWEQARVDGLAEAAKAESGAGTYETAVLYEEMDGVYLALQGKDRKEYGPSREMKVSIAYSGVYEDAGGRRTLANKVSYASMEQAGNFRRHAEGVVADFYAVETVQRRIFNSDGGTWLQRNMVPGCTCQLDHFHRNKAVRTYVNDPTSKKPSWGCCTHGSPRMRLPWWRPPLKVHSTPTNRRSGASCLSTSATTNTPCCPTTSEAGKSLLCRMKVKHPHGAEAWRATSLPSLGTG